VQVRILGPFELQDGDGVVELRGARLRALLARLALDAGRLVTVEEISRSLWGDEPPADETNAVQSLVSRLRRTLPDPAALESRPGGYRLLVTADDVDALTFRSLLRSSRAAGRAGDSARADALRAEALALWRGGALSDLLDAPFAGSEAAALETARREAVDERLAADLAAGRASEILAELEAMVEAEPLRESATALLMAACHDVGRTAEALQAYERLREALADKLGVDPGPQVQQLHLQLLRGERPVTERPRPAGGRGSTLPAALTSFLGRDTDLLRLPELLQRERLVTLVGPGGAGKTRLAVEAARRAGGDGPVWMLELAPVTDPDDIAQTALDALDARELRLVERGQRSAPRDALSRVVDVLSSGPALLVVDNCEHLVEGAAQFVEHLLVRCPELRVLATSREALAVTGEVAYPVRPLPRPDPQAALDQVAAADSVRLLVDRAAAARPGFRLDESTRGAVVEVCRRLDGLPLAIELAAARLRTMTVEQLAARLDDRFRLLTGGTRTSVARHRTLHAVVEWSWELLDAEERTVAERFSVFPGGATTDAAWRVCLDACGSRADAEDVLARLAEKSILQLVVTGDDEPRYRMLETLREYGSERLREDGALERTRRCHARYYRDLVEALEPTLRTAAQLPALQQLERERDNILAALRFSVDEGDADTSVRIAAGLIWYWTINDSHAEAAAWLSAAVAVPGEAAPETLAIARAARAMTLVATDQIDFTETDKIRDLLDEIPDVDPLDGHPMLTLLAPARALLPGSDGSWQDAVEANLAHPDPWAKGVLHLFRSQLYENAGDLQGEAEDTARALEYFQQTGDRWGTGMALHGVGASRMLAGDLPGAAEAFEQALGLVRELHVAASDEMQLLLRLGTVYHRAGDSERARALLEQAESAAERSHSLMGRVTLLIARASVALDEGDVAAARGYRAEAAQSWPRLSRTPPQLEAFLLLVGAEIDLAQDSTADVRGDLERALAAATSSFDIPIAARVAVAIAGWLSVVVDRADEAARVLGAGAALRGVADELDPAIARLTARLREALGDDAFDEHFAAGAALARDDAKAALAAAVES
jgi:predicted ATPase/DNA-binding SARP family transcriptional activator